MSRILVWEVADARTYGTFFKLVIQAILLFGPETWVGTPRISRTMRVFHHGVDLWLISKQPKRRTYRNWDPPPPEKSVR